MKAKNACHESTYSRQQNTIQGEGPVIGRPTVFVRTGGCDYRCTRCDTPYAVLPEYRTECVKRVRDSFNHAVAAAPRGAVEAGHSGHQSYSRTISPMSHLHQLGRPTPIPNSPGAASLERVANPHRDTNYLARFTVPEFTALCPKTGQPDFAHLVIDYVPSKFLVESNP
jgi:hypothetical protein